MDIWRHDICHVTASRWCHISQNVSPIPSNRYYEAIFAIEIIKKVTGEKRQGGGTHPMGVRGLRSEEASESKEGNMKLELDNRWFIGECGKSGENEGYK